MDRIRFNDGWGVRRLTSPFLELMGQAEPPKSVTLPHDWLIGQPRSADAQPGALNGFYGEDVIEYVKRFEAPKGFAEGRVELDFDGVYRGAMVFVNDAFVGQRPYGYIPFSVRIDRHLREGTNEIRVECRNHLDARWYSGLGIYRDVHLLVGGPVHVARNGVRIQTVSADEATAVIEVVATLENDTNRQCSVDVMTEILAPGGVVVATESAAFGIRALDTSRLRQRFTVPNPVLWNPDAPALHTCRIRIESQDLQIESHEVTFGIRTLDWDAHRGLRLNGRSIKLRGGCIHHDNGPLGTATIARAEERRVELLKAAGYNAIRSSHNPISAAMLDACDRLGMLVMDEFTDAWTVPTNGFGYGLDLPEWWRRDLTELVERDYNHPSVVLYSIGNEVTDTGNKFDAIRGRDIVDHLKAIDDSRPVTNAINPMMTVLRELKAQIGLEDDGSGVNSFMQWVGESEQAFAASDIATNRLEEPMSQLDVSGYNYAHSRYEMDIQRHPQRLLLGTEVTPNKLDETWALVERYPQILGDFAWTAWEYIGEAGLGADKPPEEGFFGRWPWRLSGTGDLTITGERRSISYWRETVWGLRSTPYIAVEHPDAPAAETLQRSLYTWTDSLSSWSWPGREGSPLTIDVYSSSDEVLLLLNGTQVGRAPAGLANRYIASFCVAYQRGELTAIALTDGEETGRTTIRSASAELRVSATSDRQRVRSDDRDLAFIDITLTDQNGILHVSQDTTVTVSVSGSGDLQGLASAALSSEDDYASASCRTFRGRALAVIRPTGTGAIIVAVRTAFGDEVSLTIEAE